MRCQGLDMDFKTSTTKNIIEHDAIITPANMNSRIFFCNTELSSTFI